MPTHDGFPDCRADSALNRHLRRYWRIKFNYFAALLKFLETHASEFAADSCGSDCLTDFRHVALWTNHWQFDLLGLNVGKYTEDSGDYSQARGAELRRRRPIHGAKIEAPQFPCGLRAFGRHRRMVSLGWRSFLGLMKEYANQLSSIRTLTRRIIRADIAGVDNNALVSN